MGVVLRFLGRALLAIFILSSAIVKIQSPSSYVSTFTNDYNSFRTLCPGVTDLTPTVS